VYIILTILLTIMQAIYDSFNSNGSHLYANFSSLEMTFAVAIFAIGGMLGALPAGLIADQLGR
jgi:MFS family permease